MAGPLADRPTQERDPGLQPERTSLAWSRTVLGYLVVATVTLRTAHVSGAAAVGSALAYLGVAVVVALRRAPHPGRPPVLEVFALSAATAALALHWLWISE